MRGLIGILACVGLLAAATVARAQAPTDWAAVEAKARGQTVYFNAWGGEGEINDYIAWAGGELQHRYGVNLVQVKLTDTSEAVNRIVAERAAGRNEDGSVDLVWINGQNFRALKEAGLLYGPFAPNLPNFALVDTAGKPTTLNDFTVPTDGFESPWGMAQFVFFQDTARVAVVPRTLDALKAGLAAAPGRFTWPAPPNFTGETFLKQLLYATIADPARLRQPVEEAEFARLSAPMWAWVDAVRPSLWRQGRAWPASGPALHQLLADGEVDYSMAFNPAEASTLIAQGRLPPTVRSFVPDGGTIANTHFVAIPFNAAHLEGALVAANFLLSPEAQLRKADPAVWGDPTVLDPGALGAEDRARFQALPRGPATLAPDELGPQLAEPHPSWGVLIEKEWARRYAQ